MMPRPVAAVPSRINELKHHRSDIIPRVKTGWKSALAREKKQMKCNIGNNTALWLVKMDDEARRPVVLCVYDAELRGSR